MPGTNVPARLDRPDGSRRGQRPRSDDLDERLVDGARPLERADRLPFHVSPGSLPARPSECRRTRPADDRARIRHQRDGSSWHRDRHPRPPQPDVRPTPRRHPRSSPWTGASRSSCPTAAGSPGSRPSASPRRRLPATTPTRRRVAGTGRSRATR